ncbi:hypothetical protein CC79DRAFT_819453 [Sarocladium strictum]
MLVVRIPGGADIWRRPTRSISSSTLLTYLALGSETCKMGTAHALYTTTMGTSSDTYSIMLLPYNNPVLPPSQAYLTCFSCTGTRPQPTLWTFTVDSPANRVQDEQQHRQDRTRDREVVYA